MKHNRRNFIKMAGATSVSALLFNSGSLMASNNQSNVVDLSQKYSARAIEVVSQSTNIDMLATFEDWFNQRNGVPLGKVWNTVPNSFTKQDFDLVKSCGIDIFGWGSMKPSFEDMLMFIASQNGIIASNSEYFQRIDSAASFTEMRKRNKIGMLISNQNSSHFRDVDDVNLFHGLGQRVSQLTYNGKNRLGNGAFDDMDSGITEYGKRVVERMNLVGMAVDVSHCGDKTTLGGIEASSSPVLITHGACRSIAKGVARAKTDEAIKAMAKTGGVIGIPILRFMIREKEPVSLDHFLDHIDHVAQLVGIEYVGIGSDQGLYTEDFGPKEWRKSRLENAPKKYQTHTNSDYLLTIEGLNHPHRTYDIVEGLIKREYKDSDIQLVLGGNFERVLKKIFTH